MVRRSNRGRGRYFRHLSRPALHPPTSCTMDVGSVFGTKAAGAWCWQPTTSSAKVKERVELYLTLSSRSPWPVAGWTVHAACSIFGMSNNKMTAAGWILRFGFALTAASNWLLNETTVISLANNWPFCSCISASAPIWISKSRNNKIPGTTPSQRNGQNEY